MRKLRALLAIVAAIAIVPLFAQPALAAPLTTDFNGDGFADLAVGVVGENGFEGAVQVLYGSANGLTDSDQVWFQDDTGTDPSEAGDSFGASVASGDFDGDGFSDLAIGAPFENVAADNNGGAVSILYGSPIGLTDEDAQFWSQDSTDVEDAIEDNDFFGSTLAAGDFNGDGRSDLAIGVPFEDIDGIAEGGAVNVLFGSASGLTATNDQFWHQDTSGILDTAEDSDIFGWTLVAANFGMSSHDDLAIAVPGEDLDGAVNAGAVNVLYGSSSGLSAVGDQFWHQDSAGVKGTAEDGDSLGWSLAAANLGKTSQADLAIGAPFEDVGSLDGAGGVNVLYGSAGGLTATGDQTWTQDSSGIKDVADANEGLGWSMVAANFGETSQADLAIGVIFEGVSGASAAGAVNVIYGASGGLTASGDQFFHQDTLGVKDVAEEADRLGFTLAAANFGQSSQADLAIGVPYEHIDLVDDAGAVNVLYGSSGGLVVTGDQFWHQDVAGIQGVAETQDWFGWSLAPPGGGFLPE